MCLLPLTNSSESERYQNVGFNVAIYHYEVAPVLAIVATSQGTSAHLIQGKQKHLLWFNKKGTKCSFLGHLNKEVKQQVSRKGECIVLTPFRTKYKII
jgi:hypothetical protein